MSRPALPPKSMLIYFGVCTLAMVWPGALIANRIEPMVLGLPFFIFWYVLWIFILVVGLVIAYRLEVSEELTMSDSAIITGLTLGYLLVVLCVGLRARVNQSSSLETTSRADGIWGCWSCFSFWVPRFFPRLPFSARLDGLIAKAYPCSISSPT